MTVDPTSSPGPARLPSPMPLPANLPYLVNYPDPMTTFVLADHVNPLLTLAHTCDFCLRRLVYAHCDSPTCVMLWCHRCHAVHRPDIPSSYRRPDAQPDNEHNVISA